MTPMMAEPVVDYPDCDGQPLADNTLQFEWIVTIEGNLDLLFANDPSAFVAGDNLIYPVEGKPAICQAPDVYVAFGRPKGYRGSYKVWNEGGIFPQVIFEVLSPSNSPSEMLRKRLWYEKYGAEEYYVLDPELLELEGYVRGPTGLVRVPEMNGFRSPRMGVAFEVEEDGIELRSPGGSRFLTFVEFGQLQQETARQVEAEKRRAESERERGRQVGREAPGAGSRSRRLRSLLSMRARERHSVMVLVAGGYLL